MSPDKDSAGAINSPTKTRGATRAYSNNNNGLRKFPSGCHEKVRNIFCLFFAVPPSHTYILGHPKQLFFYNISSLNASFRHDSKLGYYQLLQMLPFREKIKVRLVQIGGWGHSPYLKGVPGDKAPSLGSYCLFRQNTYLQNKKHMLTCQGGTGCYRFNYQPGS